MKGMLWTLAALAALPASAYAQDKDRDRKADELRKTFERSVRELEERFRAEREKLDRSFREKVEALRRGGAPRKGETPKAEPAHAIERLARAVAELRREVDDLKRLVGKRHGKHDRKRPRRGHDR